MSRTKTWSVTFYHRRLQGAQLRLGIEAETSGEALSFARAVAKDMVREDAGWAWVYYSGTADMKPRIQLLDPVNGWGTMSWDDLLIHPNPAGVLI